MVSVMLQIRNLRLLDHGISSFMASTPRHYTDRTYKPSNTSEYFEAIPHIPYPFTEQQNSRTLNIVLPSDLPLGAQERDCSAKKAAVRSLRQGYWQRAIWNRYSSSTIFSQIIRIAQCDPAQPPVLPQISRSHAFGASCFCVIFEMLDIFRYSGKVLHRNALCAASIFSPSLGSHFDLNFLTCPGTFRSASIAVNDIPLVHNLCCHGFLKHASLGFST